jgi:hypothetical protein
MVRRLLLWWVVLLMVLGCHSVAQPKPVVPPAPPPQVAISFPTVVRTVYVDPSFNAGERDAISEAMMEWAVATRGIIEWHWGDLPIPEGAFPFKGEGCPKIFLLAKASSESEIVQQLEAGDPGPHEKQAAHTLVSCKLSMTVVVWDRIDSGEQFTQVVKHELGHHFGLKHYKTGLMAENPDEQEDCVTKADLVEFCKIESCDPKYLNPCD